MPNKAASIGFAGTESYDLILYLAVMLTALDKKVLLVDNSCHKALSCCIPVSDIAGREKDVHYKGLDVRRDTPLVTLEGEYDFILMDFGQNISHNDIKSCDSLCLVTDTGLHNIAVIEPLKAAVEDTYLLIRELPNGLDENFVLKLINEKEIWGKKSFYFYFDEADKEAMAALQYNNSVSYKKLSPAIKYFLKEISREAFGMNERQVKLAEKKLAEKNLGRRR